MQKVDPDFDLPEGAEVIFRCGDLEGSGYICGISGRQPGMTMYIVSVATKLPSGHPYSCIVVPSGCLVTIGPEDELTARDKVSFSAGREIPDAEWEKWLQFCVEDPYGDLTFKGDQP